MKRREFLQAAGGVVVASASSAYAVRLLITSDLGNVRAAWGWAVKCGKEIEIGQGLESLHLFYYEQGWYQQGEEALREAAAGLGDQEGMGDVAGPGPEGRQGG